MKTATEIFNRPETETENGTKNFPTENSEPKILCTNFIRWSAEYNGPKFSLFHCDFPPATGTGASRNQYNALLDALLSNIFRLSKPQSHLMLWLNMSLYVETKIKLENSGFSVSPAPLVWHKTGLPVGPIRHEALTVARQTYETALLATLGSKPFSRPGASSYAAPDVTSKIHQDQKPEPMLRFFLSMLVDPTTVFLDPTCGIGSAVRAADDLGARSVLGLELEPHYAEIAYRKTSVARNLRQMKNPLVSKIESKIEPKIELKIEPKTEPEPET